MTFVKKFVDRGEGDRLGDFQSADAEVQAFITSVPALAAKIRNIFNAIQEGSLGKKINNVVEVTFLLQLHFCSFWRRCSNCFHKAKF